MNWEQVKELSSKDYKCGYCGTSISSAKGYHANKRVSGQVQIVGRIYICHKCLKPSFFDDKGNQTPGPIIGASVKHIPDPNIEAMINEAKACYSINAFTSSVMCCRKLLMNISVAQGAKEGKGFVDYVDYLNDNNYIPPNGKEWVDSIRKLGNEANHQIEFKTKKEASRILNFTEMLLRFIYELPGIMKENTDK